jgi:hypothetical protein
VRSILSAPAIRSAVDPAPYSHPAVPPVPTPGSAAGWPSAAPTAFHSPAREGAPHADHHPGKNGNTAQRTLRAVPRRAGEGSSYLSRARRPPPVGVGMHGPVPEGTPPAPVCSGTVPPPCGCAAFHAQAFPWANARAPRGRGAVRHAGAAPTTSLVLTATHVGALGRQRSGAPPQKPPAWAVGSRHSASTPRPLCIA